MRRSEAERMIRRSDLTPADRLVFLALCQRADNVTSEIPAKFTPSLKRLADETGLHTATVKRSLAHLELHRWIQRERTKGGRKRKDGAHHRTQYHVICCGAPLPCDCPRKPPGRPRKQVQDEPVPEPAKQAHHAPVSEPKQAHSAPRNRRIEYDNAAGQPANCTEGLREGGDRGRKGMFCTVCGNVLDPVLPAARYRTHPCCDPAEQSATGLQPVTLPALEAA